MQRSPFNTFVLTLLALPAFGCTAAVDAPEEESIESTSEALTPVGFFATNGENVVDIGPYTASRTCFLTGVLGRLHGKNNFGDADPASVKVYPSGGNWKLKATYGFGQPIKGFATCFDAQIANRDFHAVSFERFTEEFWIERTSVTRCFLTELESIDAFVGYNNSSLRLTKGVRWWGGEPHDVWIFGASIGDQADPGWSAKAKAVCFDRRMFEEYESAFISNNTLPVPLSNGTCGMTGIQGNFGSATVLANEGADFQYDVANDEWTAHASSGKTMWASCYK